MYITCSFLTPNLFSYMALYPLVYKTTGLADHRFMLGGFITRLRIFTAYSTGMSL